MPRPIPEWDQFRVLMSYLLKRQLDHQPTTIKQASQRMGVGAEKLQQLLSDNQVDFTLLQTTEKKKHEGLEIVIERIPLAYEKIFKIEGERIEKSYQHLVSREITLQPEPDRNSIRRAERLRRKLRAMRYFLNEEQVIS